MTKNGRMLRLTMFTLAQMGIFTLTLTPGIAFAQMGKSFDKSGADPAQPSTPKIDRARRPRIGGGCFDVVSLLAAQARWAKKKKDAK